MQLASRSLVVALVVLLGCAKKSSEARPDPAVASDPAPITEPAPSAPTVAAAPTPAPVVVETGVPASFPPACVAYAALIDRLQACDKAGAARDGLSRGYHELRAAWPTVQPDQRAAIELQCKAQADSLRDAAAATCGW